MLCAVQIEAKGKGLPFTYLVLPQQAYLMRLPSYFGKTATYPQQCPG